MANSEAINWIINISADIGKAEHRDLWHYEQALSEIRDMLETAQPEQQWIPCSERLPERGKEVLATWTDGNNYEPIIVTYNMEFNHPVWYDLFGSYSFDVEEIIAWMPLPEPYRAERRTDGEIH